MSRISTMLTVCTLLAATASAVAERDPGLHPIGRTVDLSWTAREGNASGPWIGTSAMRGLLDHTDDGNAILLAGWQFRCEDFMSGSGNRIEADPGTAASTARARAAPLASSPRRRARG